jgi:uncharacterized protein (TIGR00369 family)
MTSRLGETTASAWGTPHRREVVWYDAGEPSVGRSGIELLGAIRDGVVAPPPMASLLGLVVVEVEPGRVVFECGPDGSTYNPLGMVHGGLVSALADTVCGCALHTTLPAGTAYSTIDLAVSFLRPVTVDSGTLRATGSVRKSGRRVAFTEASIVDASGREVATATSSLLVSDAAAR